MYRERSEQISTCPVCGEELFSWVLATATGTEEAPGHLVARCENCGLGVNREPPAPAEPELTEEEGEARVAGLERARDLPAVVSVLADRIGPGGGLAIRFPNRASLQASLGGPRWFELDAASQRYLLTATALERLLSRAGLEPGARRWRAGASLLAMWQTALNSLTFHRDFAWRLARRRPLGPPGLTLWLDLVITAIAALPVAVIVFPIECAAALAGRGGVLEVRARRRTAP